MNNLAIEARNVSKSFKFGSKELEVIKNISFEIKKGEFLSIMGPSGCGKSTLLYMLGALDKPTKGSILINSKNYNDVSSKELAAIKRRVVGFIFQFYNLVPNLTVKDNILLPLYIDKRNIKQYKEKLAEILELTGISDKLNSLPSEISGGQQQRVAIARALIIEPEILLADEPIGNLDTRTGEKIMELFKEINERYGTTIVQVTHSKEASEYGTSLMRLRDGIILDEK